MPLEFLMQKFDPRFHFPMTLLKKSLIDYQQSQKKSVEVTQIVDKSLIGGISVRLGDQVIDGTVKHQLEKLKEQFSE